MSRRREFKPPSVDNSSEDVRFHGALVHTGCVYPTFLPFVVEELTSNASVQNESFHLCTRYSYYVDKATT